MMTIEKNRFNMIEQQIRPWYVFDQEILNALLVLKRENFLPESQKSLAFFDTELPLPDGSHTFPPKLEARIVQELALKKQDSVLLIGANNAYLAALLGFKAREVRVTESNPETLTLAKKNLHDNDVHNVSLFAANGLVEPQEGQYDVIVINGSVERVPEFLQQQLSVGGRLFSIVGTAPVMSANLTTRESAQQFSTKTVFETVVPAMPQSIPNSKFTF